MYYLQLSKMSDWYTQHPFCHFDNVCVYVCRRYFLPAVGAECTLQIGLDIFSAFESLIWYAKYFGPEVNFPYALRLTQSPDKIPIVVARNIYHICERIVV